MRTRFFLLLIPVLIFAVGAGWEGDLAQSIFEAYQQGEQVTNPSGARPDLDVAGAYRIQALLVDKLAQEGGGVIGYKAALTGEAAQKKFGVADPAYGVLTQNMLFQPGAEIDPSGFRRLFLEIEIALFLNRDITEPLPDAAAARDAVEAAAPAVELPDIRFSDMKNLKGVDIIADNSGAAGVIVGPKSDLSLSEVDQVQTSLSLNGQVINTGLATDALGGQFEALRWLANTLIANGGKLEKGQFVITGATGKMLPAKPGDYLADYGPLGKIEFKVK